MKQLLATKDAHVVVALNERAYFGDLGSEKISELVVPRTTMTSDSASASESVPIAAITEDRREKNGEEGDSVDKQGNNVASNNVATNMINPKQVQAVSVTQDSCDVVWCGVARYDKTLALYKIPSNDTTQQDATTATIMPVTVHKTGKRVSSLCFGRVPGVVDEDPAAITSTNNTNRWMTVIVAGDLAGDAIAYSIQETVASKFDSNSNSNHRVLLGHTASMLTSVRIVETTNSMGKTTTAGNTGLPPQHQVILTADRDEKIRVSSFPDTYNIHGYLLGHTAFVSGMAVSHKTSSLPSTPSLRCVSIGGDNTLRLWDVETCRELATAAAAGSSTLTTLSCHDDDDDDKQDGESTASAAEDLPVPSNVALNVDGDLVVTIYDDSKYLDLWEVFCTSASGDDSNGDQKTAFDLHKSCVFECAAQPLAVSFLETKSDSGGLPGLLVVMKEPEYMQTFCIERSKNNSLAITPTNLPFCTTIRKLARDDNKEMAIVMPDRILEKDEHGNLKMQKMNEKRSGATLMPWNNSERKQVAKERNSRLRKRRRQTREQESKQQEAVTEEAAVKADDSSS